MKSRLVSDFINTGGHLIFNPQDGYTTLFRPGTPRQVVLKSITGNLLCDLSTMDEAQAIMKVVEYATLGAPFVVQKGQEVRVFTGNCPLPIFLQSMKEIW